MLLSIIAVFFTIIYTATAVVVCPGHGAVWRSRAALAKSFMMGAYSVFVLGKATWSLTVPTAPDPATMGAIGFIALVANSLVALLLYAYLDGDANMRSVWLCSRNDAIGNVAAVVLGAHASPNLLLWCLLVTAVFSLLLYLAAMRIAL